MFANKYLDINIRHHFSSTLVYILKKNVNYFATTDIFRKFKRIAGRKKYSESIPRFISPTRRYL